jgi:hypothetical protein
MTDRRLPEREHDPGSAPKGPDVERVVFIFRPMAPRTHGKEN